MQINNDKGTELFNFKVLVSLPLDINSIESTCVTKLNSQPYSYFILGQHIVLLLVSSIHTWRKGKLWWKESRTNVHTMHNHNQCRNENWHKI